MSIQQNLLHDPTNEQRKSQLGLFVDDKGLIRCREDFQMLNFLILQNYSLTS